MTSTATQILAIVAKMETELGHFWTYHLAAKEAASLLGWNYIAAAPTTSTIEKFPEQWCKCLKIGCLKIGSPTRFPRSLQEFRAHQGYSSSARQFLNDHVDSSKENIIFLEFLNLEDLRILTHWLLESKRQNIFVWILFREPVDHLDYNFYPFRRWLKAIVWLLGKNNIRFLGDTQGIVDSWKKFLNQPVHLVLHLHTAPSMPEAFPRPHDLVVCWWPGQPRASKGLTIVQDLIQSPEPEARKLLLLIAGDAYMYFGRASTHLQLVPTVLSSSDYFRWMATSDVILLPYKSEYYTHVSSSIFVEAITYGKVPLVSNHTWASREFEKHDLSELIMDWEAKDLVKRILRLAKDTNTKKKLEKMRQVYQECFSVPSFAKTIHNIHRVKTGR